MAFSLTPRGSCQADDAATLTTFKNIQREANRLLDLENRTLLTVDGKIGVKTLAAVNSLLTGTGGFLASSFSTCSELVNRASTVLFQLTSLANKRSAPVVADPETIVRSLVSPPDTVSPSGQVVRGSVTNASVAGIPLWAILLGGGGAAYYLLRSKKKRKAKKAKAAAKVAVPADLIGSL